MLQKTTIDFLKKLKNNNNREWFEANRKEYESAKKDFQELVQTILTHLSKSDTRYNELEVKHCVFRINRDVRFSKDKSPYKTNFGAGFSIGGKKSTFAGFYLHIDPTASFAGGGLWMPETDRLKNVRQEIDYNFKDFSKIIFSKKFISEFGSIGHEDKLKNPPKGYDINNEAIEYLKLKSFVAMHSFTEEEMMEKDFAKKIGSSFDILSPFIQFINKGMK